jgi:hypothetical protein
MRFALAGQANERAAAAVKVRRILVGAFMPDFSSIKHAAVGRDITSN